MNGFKKTQALILDTLMGKEFCQDQVKKEFFFGKRSFLLIMEKQRKQSFD